MSKYLQDEKLLVELKAGHQRAWKQLFDEHLEAFQLFVMKYGKVSKEKAFELYQEGVIILHRNISDQKLESPLRASLQTYLFGIGKNLCKRTSSNYLNFPDEIPDVPQYPFEEIEERKHNAALVRGLLQKIGEKCRQFLTMIFLEEIETEQIMSALEVPSAEAFRKRKHDCLKKMRELL
jgi:RNA polymerase sigma factor (sigma-70 family)